MKTILHILMVLTFGFGVLRLNASVEGTVAGMEMQGLSYGMNIFYIRHGKLPKGKNSDIVKQFETLREFDKKHARLDKEGNILDPFGVPYIFLFSEKGDCVIVSIGRALREKDARLVEYCPVVLKQLDEVFRPKPLQEGQPDGVMEKPDGVSNATKPTEPTPANSGTMKSATQQSGTSQTKIKMKD